MKGTQLVLVAVLVGGLSECGTFYPGDPPEQKPRFTAALNGGNESPCEFC